MSISAEILPTGPTLKQDHKYAKETARFYPTFYRPQLSFGQGYIFTGVCHSVNGGGGGGILAYTEADPPGTRHPPKKIFVPYGQSAGGTHPSGMHSC